MVENTVSGPTRWKRDLLVFGGLGIALFALAHGIHWLELTALTGNVQQRHWFHGLETAVIIVTWIVALLLLILAVLRWRWIPLVAFGGAQVLCWAVILAVLVAGPPVEVYASRVPFESARWKAENRKGANAVRVHMVDGLRKRHRLLGMSRAAVNDLLGVPPETPYFREYDYVYWLGPERGWFPIDSEWLVLKFRDEVVVEATVVTD